MVDLPQELIDAIVDNVAQTKEWHQAKDFNTLKACALTARGFVVPSQRHLFRSFTMRPSSAKITDISGCSRFIGNPTLASYIRDLEISILPNIMQGSSSQSQLLASFLPLLIRLKRLVIDWCYHSPEWDLVLPSFRTAFNGLLSCPTLRCFGIRDCPSIPASVVRHALASFQEVAFNNVGVGKEDKASSFMVEVARRNPGPRRLLIRPALRSGDTTLQTSILAQKSTGFLGALEHLELCLSNPGTLNGCEEIAQACSTSLRHMVIDFNSMRHHPISPLPAMPEMRVLTLVCSARRLRIATPLQSIAASLPVCMPGLEAVNFVLDSDILDLAQPNCQNMDEALTNLASLRKVHFTIACSHHNPQHLVDVFRKILPLTNGAGLLSFNICDVNGLPSRTRSMYCFSN